MRLINVTPPVYLFLYIGIMVLLHFLLPMDKIITLPWNLLGIIPLTLGIVINIVADKTFKIYETTVKPLERSTTLITTGVFRLTRHPMYLGFVLILLGIAVFTGSFCSWVVVLAFAFFMDACHLFQRES